MNVYITDLASYNNGNLVGEWVSLPLDNEDLKSKINSILELGSEIDGYDEIDEEYFITDFECDYYDVDEYENISKLNEIAELMEGLSDYERKAVTFLLDNYLVNSFEEALEKYDDVIIYEDCSMYDIAYDIVQESFNIEKIPSNFSNYIDYYALARDLKLEGRYYEVDNAVYEYIG